MGQLRDIKILDTLAWQSSKKEETKNAIFNPYEIEEVNAGVGLPGAGFGGAMGGLSYFGSATTSGNFSWSGFGTAIAVGAASGATKMTLLATQWLSMDSVKSAFFVKKRPKVL